MATKRILVDFNDFIYSVSLALDLAEACTFRDRSRNVGFHAPVPNFSVYNHNFANHSKRTALVSLLISKQLGFEGSRYKNLYLASFMHDIGAVEAFSKCHSDSDFMGEHSEFGANIIKKLPIDSVISEYIRYHHENNNGSGPKGLAGNEIPMESHIIHLADMFELMYNSEAPYWVQKDKIREWISSSKGTLFAADAVDAFIAASESERFWLDAENIESEPEVLSRISPPVDTPMSLNTIKDISLVFAAIIDKKSSFTHEHSMGLSDYAERFALRYGFDGEKSVKFKIAALLHDLGKLSVPNSILDKPGKLTAEEFAVIKSHTYYTKLILEKIKGMEEIAHWAANHHETLRGTGYPEGIGADMLSLESRIIAVCDIYQALTEARPYREGMQKGNALKIIDSLVDRGDIDAKIVRDLKELI